MPFLEQAPIKFILSSTPENTPLNAEFFLETSVLGFQPSLPNWQFSLQNGQYTLTQSVPLGTLLEFKVSRGSHQTEEGNPYGRRSFARRLVVTQPCEVSLEVLGWQDLPGEEPPHTLSGQVERITLYSPELEDDLTILVYRPPRYNRSSARYPVLYMHDGANVFDAATSYAGVEWGVDEAAEQLALEGLEGMVVAVEVRGKHRITDYTPFKSRVNGYAPGADTYTRFLTETLKPFIDNKYRTLGDREHTGIAGASFGGLISLYAGLARADIYGFIGAFSPSLWLGDFEMFGWLETQDPSGSRIYVDMGTHEGDDIDFAALTQRQAKILATLLEGRGAKVRFVTGEGHWHDETAWAERFPAVLRWFLKSSNS